ncbi:MAG: hypothetical protein MW689_000679 [Thermodesulfobacteria bacterium]|nr:hypothetical protein [Thermodesulfobacteriota bacterium]MCU4138890.1 hypothetical protein [Thermodesulfobacteriota bacterium]
MLKESLGELANKNPSEVKIKELLEASSKFFSTRNKSLIVIIDGLDHVLRHDDKRELIEFFKRIFTLTFWSVVNFRNTNSSSECITRSYLEKNVPKNTK